MILCDAATRYGSVSGLGLGFCVSASNSKTHVSKTRKVRVLAAAGHILGETSLIPKDTYFTNSFKSCSHTDFNEAVPETERLDSKALKTRAQLSVKNKRQRPTRTRLYDSISSTDGEDSLERKVRRTLPSLSGFLWNARLPL